MDERLTTAQAGRALRISPCRVRQLIAAGRLRAVRFGRAWLIARKDLAAVIHRPPGRPPGSAEKGRRA